MPEKTKKKGVDEQENKNELNEEQCEPGKTCSSNHVVQHGSCASQYCNMSNNQYLMNEESNPDELASYFEQILYIPKPMSAMAQMMYA